MPRDYSQTTVRTFRRELNLVKSRYGTLTKDNIVAWARDNPGSRLHGEFDWDVESAAQKYWIVQAGRIMQACKIFVTLDDEEGQPKREPVRVYVSTVVKGERQYQEVDEVLAKKVSRESLLEEFRRDFQLMERKYRVHEFLGQHLAILRRALEDMEERGEEMPSAARRN